MYTSTIWKICIFFEKKKWGFSSCYFPTWNAFDMLDLFDKVDIFFPRIFLVVFPIPLSMWQYKHCAIFFIVLKGIICIILKVSTVCSKAHEHIHWISITFANVLSAYLQTHQFPFGIRLFQFPCLFACVCKNCVN